MANVFVIWDRNNLNFVGGSAPRVFQSSSDATTAATRVLKYTPQAKKGQTAPAFDVITVTA